jgi:hypothetical protein
VTDLSPLRDAPLTFLRCERSGITDLSPGSNAPLEEIRSSFDRARDAKVLRSMPKLKRINNLPVADSWKQMGMEP